MQLKSGLTILLVCLWPICNDARSPDHLWDRWKRQHKKHYEGLEEEFRRNIWEEAVDDISEHNLRHSLSMETYSKTMNKYSDLLWEEFRERFLADLPSELPKDNRVEFASDKIVAPKALHWPKKGFVSPVKDQGQCIASYALATCGALEAQQKKKTGFLVELSAQQLVDCSTDQPTDKNSGCAGGQPVNAYQYISQFGIQTESSYPYVGKKQACKYDREKVVFKSSTNFTTISHAENEDELRLLLAAQGPVVIGMHVLKDLRHYSEGVFTHPACRVNNLNHAALLVGYGEEKGFEYWTVKNSWGEDWGDKGYFKIARNRVNMCGVAKTPSVPIL